MVWEYDFDRDKAQMLALEKKEQKTLYTTKKGRGNSVNPTFKNSSKRIKPFTILEISRDERL